MIAIVNIDPNPRLTGRHLYSLRINKRELCQFHHSREDGLAICLGKAAKAYTLQGYVNLVSSAWKGETE